MILVEDLFGSVSSELNESTGEKKLYLKGVFMEAEAKNRNGRIYAREEMKREVDKVNALAEQGRYMLGENGHPPGRIEVDMEKASHKITEMWMEGDQAYGKSEVLIHTPSGKILEGLINSGVHLGVSSRGTGKLDESTNRVSNFTLHSVDTVLNPSAHNAYPTSIRESLEMYNRGEIVDDLAEAVLHDKQAQAYFAREMKRFIESLRA